ncbi:MAG: rhodanese-like domain-containing protein [Rhodospirillaceae bacterium]
MAGRFVGDVEAEAAWRGLAESEKAVLIDVRTQAEWSYVGIPDLASLKRRVILIEWQSFPAGHRNPAFVEEVVAKGIGPGQPIYLLCRSGVRSRAAAEALALRGYTTYNIADGFEGQLDPAGHRGTTTGWKVAGLPWTQS